MTQPKALYLAEILQSEPGAVADAAAEEMRRLHDEVRMLQEQNTELDKKLAALSERHLNDEVIAELWHQNGGFHHHFARAVERWLRGEK